MEVFVPGRLCILGEHTDWAGEYRDRNPGISKGHTIVCATNEGLYARLTELSGNCISYEHHGKDDSSIILSLSDIESLRSKAKEGGFYSYVIGSIVATLDSQQFRSFYGIQGTDFSTVKGLHINNFQTTLPMKKGLSSSAAVCVLIVKSLALFYNLSLSNQEVMNLAYLGEMMTPSHCGRMDQCVVMGSNAIAIMEFDNSSVTLDIIKVKVPIYFVVVDLLGSKDTIRILGDLNACFPNPANETQELMIKYVNGIETIAKDAKLAIEKGEIIALADAMNNAQSLFDECAMPNCPSELTSPKLHALINDSWVRANSLAVKGVGSQGDGSAQILCSSLQQQSLVYEYVTSKLQLPSFTLTISGENEI